MRKLIYSLFIPLISLSLSAQNDSILLFPHTETNKLLVSGKNANIYLSNPSFLGNSQNNIGSFIDFNYKQENGDFYKLGEPLKFSEYGMKMEGQKALGKLNFQAYFEYLKRDETDREWSYQINDDFYYPVNISDSIGGAWKLNKYKLGFNMATDKLFGKIYSGIGLDYTLFHGGKNSDPRPKNLGMDVSFKPGLTFEINSSNFIGLAGIYRIYKEDLDLINEYGIGGNTLFKIIGLGQFGTPEVKTSLTYRYFKNEFGLNAQYMKQKDTYSWINALSYSSGIAQAIDSPNRAMFDEETQEVVSLAEIDAESLVRNFSASSNLAWSTNLFHSRILLKYTFLDIKTVLPAINQVGYLENSTNFTIDYLRQKYKAKEHMWTLNLKTGYFHDNSSNALYADMKFDRLFTEINMHRSFIINQKSTFGGAMGLAYNFIMDGKLDINPLSSFIEEETVISDEYLFPLFNYLNTNYITYKTSLVYLYKVNKTLYYSLNCSYKVFQDYINRDYRNLVEISLKILI